MAEPREGNGKGLAFLNLNPYCGLLQCSPKANPVPRRPWNGSWRRKAVCERQPPATSGFPVTLGLPPTPTPGPFGSFCDAPAPPPLEGGSLSSQSTQHGHVICLLQRRNEMPSQGRTTLNPLFWRPQFYHLPLKGSPPFKPQPFHAAWILPPLARAIPIRF